MKLFMFDKNAIYTRLTRITSTGNFIPQIDSLRFIAITVVVLFHLHGFFDNKTSDMNYSIHANFDWPSIFFINGHQGVELFFVISGLVLSIPFAKYYLGKGNKVNLKHFYLRRLTRLEPPYILIMIILFFTLIFLGKYTYAYLLPHLWSSLSYTHNIIYQSTPIITVVAWSLEIEVQFYIIAPFLCYVFCLPTLGRRIVIALLIISFPLLRYFYKLTFISLYDYLEYFLIGFYLTDLYINSENKKNLGKTSEIIIGLSSLFMLLIINNDQSIFHTYIYMIIIILFYHMTLQYSTWSQIMNKKFFTVIGGMCYSIYLLHYTIISMIGNKSILIQFTSNYWVNFTLQVIIILPFILFISGIFYILIERPCMDKLWISKLVKKLKTMMALHSINK